MADILIHELWRVNLVAVMFTIGLIPLLMPSVGFKKENLILMLGVFPVIAFILLTGGSLNYSGFLLPNFIMAPSLLKFWIDFIILTAIIVGIVYALVRATDSDPAPAVKQTLIGYGCTWLWLCCSCPLNLDLKKLKLTDGAA